MKKGFTFVELAIVLVIIGIIMGMAIKGKALIDVARIRKDVRNVERLQGSIAGWIAATSNNGSTGPVFAKSDNRTGSGYNVGSQIYPETMIQKGFINASDLKISGGDLEWQIHKCKETPENNAMVFMAAQVGNGGVDICIRQNISKKLACYIEVIMDDQNLVTGDGRARELRDGSDFGAGPVNSYDCEKVNSGNVHNDNAETGIMNGYYYKLW